MDLMKGESSKHFNMQAIVYAKSYNKAIEPAVTSKRKSLPTMPTQGNKVRLKELCQKFLQDEKLRKQAGAS